MSNGNVCSGTRTPPRGSWTVRAVYVLVVALVLGPLNIGLTALLPAKPESLKFAVIGDNGTGVPPQYEVAEQMVRSRANFPFDLVIMLGDNFYGSQRPADLVNKFERPYAPLLQAGVVFRAAIGNHDDPSTLFYGPINMEGQRYYTFARKNVRFFVLDTNRVDTAQLEWFTSELARAAEPWKICYFHHPLYSDAARHGSAVDVRVLLEPILVQGGVHIVFSGHDHLYERVKPQKGIHYFVAGSAGQLRKGDLQVSALTAVGFDQDQTFMLVEIDGDDLFFEAITRTGRVVDTGTIRRARPSTTQ